MNNIVLCILKDLKKSEKYLFLAASRKTIRNFKIDLKGMFENFNMYVCYLKFKKLIQDSLAN